MTPESGHLPSPDIRSRFQNRRLEDHARSPSGGAMIRLAENTAPLRPARNQEKSAFLWIGSAAAAAALLLAAGGLFFEPSPPSASLAESLPVLLDVPGRPLFADLDAVSSSPSDFLLPERLKFDLP